MAGVSAVIAAGLATLGAGQVSAHRDARAVCKPQILTQAQVAKALGFATVKIAMAPASPEGVPQVPGQPVHKAKEFECDWGLATSGHIGLEDGRASLFVFGSAAAATAWFTAYVSHEKPACKPITFAEAACDQIGPFPGGVYPLFQAVRGRNVVWIHLIEKRVKLATLEALANDVLAHAP